MRLDAISRTSGCTRGISSDVVRKAERHRGQGEQHADDDEGHAALEREDRIARRDDHLAARAKRQADQSRAGENQFGLAIGPDRINAARAGERLDDVKHAVGIEGQPLRTPEGHVRARARVPCGSIRLTESYEASVGAET